MKNEHNPIYGNSHTEILEQEKTVFIPYLSENEMYQINRKLHAENISFVTLWTDPNERKSWTLEFYFKDLEKVKPIIDEATKDVSYKIEYNIKYPEKEKTLQNTQQTVKPNVEIIEEFAPEIEIDASNGIVSENYNMRTEDDRIEKYADIELSAKEKEEIENIKRQENISSPGISEEDERKRLIEFLEAKAANERSSYIANLLGSIYYTEVRNIPKATESFEKAMEYDANNPVAARNLAIVLEKQEIKDMKRIFDLYSVASSGNDPIALNNLACCYLQGEGVSRNVKKAVKCFTEAIKQNDALAMVNLGDMYSVGNGIKRDSEKAFKLYMQGANLNNSKALRRVGECFLDGEGVKQDVTKALAYLTKAQDLGDDKAGKIIEIIKNKYIPEKHTEKVIPKIEEPQKDGKPKTRLDVFKKLTTDLKSKEKSNEIKLPNKAKGGDAL